LLLILAGCGPQVPVSLQGLRATERSRAQDAVALVIRVNPDGTLTYGAGLVVDGKGTIATNLHVVADALSLHVLFYDPGRPSYSPLDGGLSRYLFEHEGSLVPARLTNGDPLLDLALITVDAAPASARPLAWRNQPAQPGDSIVALGHPKEAVWSFTSGVVSALHEGVIQHDAPINQGNSGGPLIDSKGHALGLNTLKLMGDAEGLGFARPIALLNKMLGRTQGPTKLDLSTPRSAYETCIHALELASADLPRCSDWEGFVNALVQAALRSAGATHWAEADRAALETKLRRSPALHRSNLELWLREALVSDPGGGARMLASSWSVMAVEQGPVWHSDAPPVLAAEPDAHLDPTLLETFGLRIDPRNPRAIQEMLKLGTRVRDLTGGLPGRAWLWVEGRNTDGSRYHFAQLMVLHEESWRVSCASTPADLAELPPDWPAPLATLGDLAAGLADVMEWGVKAD
jgi:hypothetical protein